MATQASSGPTRERILALDEAKIRVIVDNETDTLSSVDEGVPQVPEVIQLAARQPTSRTHQGHAGKVVFDQLCCACHGLSVLVTGRHGEEARTLLFDVGPYPEVWLDNARRLDVDLASIECVFLSHWHFDHSGALPEVIAAISRARKAAGKDEPVIADLHPDRPDQRGVLLPSGEMLLLPEEPRFDDIIRGGGRIATHADAHTLCGGFFFASGAIERVTDGFGRASSPPATAPAGGPRRVLQRLSHRGATVQARWERHTILFR